MKCKISNNCCPYHSCFKDECKKNNVFANSLDFGKGFCEIEKDMDPSTDEEIIEIVSPSVLD